MKPGVEEVSKMTLVRWEPLAGQAFRELSRWQREVDRLFEDFFAPVRGEARVPAVDVSETENEVILKAELPGVTKENLSVEATPSEVRISAQTSDEQETRRGEYLRRERRWGKFERVVAMPAEVKAGEAKASFKDGLLEITLPKTESAKAAQGVKVEVK
jgi:HSP20 family protein